MTTAPSYFKTYADADFDLQRPADVAADRVRAIGSAYAAAGVPDGAGIALR